MKRVAYVNYVESKKDGSDPEGNDVHVVELKLGPPYICTSLNPAKGKEKANGSKSYSFDITKVD